MFCLNDNCDVGRQGDHKPGKSGVLRDFYEHGKPGEFSENSVQLREIFNKQNSFSSIKYLHNTASSCASDEQNLVNIVDGHSALVTCYIAGVNVE